MWYVVFLSFNYLHGKTVRRCVGLGGLRRTYFESAPKSPGHNAWGGDASVLRRTHSKIKSMVCFMTHGVNLLLLSVSTTDAYLELKYLSCAIPVH